jgi:hypothetical protein
VVIDNRCIESLVKVDRVPLTTKGKCVEKQVEMIVDIAAEGDLVMICYSNKGILEIPMGNSLELR